MHADPLKDIEHALWDAQPHELLETAARLIQADTAAADVEILLVDYRQAYLVPAVGRGRVPVRLDNTAPGHAFAARQVVQDATGHTLHLPLVVHGDRLGVLSVRLPEPADRTTTERLTAVATVLARALRIADLHTDRYRSIRRRSRLTLAAEIQWDLLPGTACATDEFHLAGQLEPAYAVWGDNFDWAISERYLTLTVSDGMGTGVEAAALTHLAVSALRNARRSGADISEQAALADQTLYARHRGDRHVATLLMEVELDTGRVRVIDAGSPRVYRMRGNTTEAVRFESQLPLGMFGDADYTAEYFALEPGDRLVIVSDGVHTARSSAGENYGEAALAQALRDTRLQDPPEAVRTFIRHYLSYHGAAEPQDDAVVVFLDWTGKNPEA
ncbi:PP2C family protein-serine/threonine phosphatase [Actinomadura kijaniata]|uniref:Serine phosphatase RsbU (Regulator of sigma subunit) n=1 Tax=Actinomadura namibiensis TaxID=182080 RepID=A0A7W3LL23_ACTNM|nr:PP2C family protein-serine/threonine phosphatase [Actinomadura namibiensis]MBA8950086.1 serine phosphatase RsbU (regulator of sigma subunit) [Actinomadura namibiensis]